MRRCVGKQRLETKQEAIAQRGVLAASVRRVGTKPISVYRCDQCLGWHVGNTGGVHATRHRRSGKRPNKRMRGRA